MEEKSNIFNKNHPGTVIVESALFLLPNGFNEKAVGLLIFAAKFQYNEVKIAIFESFFLWGWSKQPEFAIKSN